MKRISLLALLVAGVLLVVHCAGNTPDEAPPAVEVAPDETPTPSILTFEKVQYATIRGIAEEPVTLYAGTWLGEPAVPGSSSRPRIDLVDLMWEETDLDRDGDGDVGVLLSQATGGTGDLLYLAAIISDEGTPTNPSTVLVGDRVQVMGMSSEAGAISMDLVVAGPEDPMCCPTRKVRRSWKFSGGALSEGRSVELGTMSLADLEGAWKLVEFARGDAVPMSVKITAVFDGGRLTGSAACNDYFTSYESPEPGRISLGMIGATKKACIDAEAMLAESKYLGILSKITSHGFHFGRLALNWRDGQALQTLMFERRAAE